MRTSLCRVPGLAVTTKMESVRRVSTGNERSIATPRAMAQTGQPHEDSRKKTDSWRTATKTDTRRPQHPDSPGPRHRKQGIRSREATRTRSHPSRHESPGRQMKDKTTCYQAGNLVDGAPALHGHSRDQTYAPPPRLPPRRRDLPPTPYRPSPAGGAATTLCPAELRSCGVAELPGCRATELRSCRVVALRRWCRAR